MKLYVITLIIVVRGTMCMTWPLRKEEESIFNVEQFYIANQVEFVVASCNTLSSTFKESQSSRLSSCSTAMTYQYNKACTAIAADVLQKFMKFARNVSAGDDR